MVRYVMPIALALLLAACASPQEKCLRDSARELQVIDALIAEQQLVVARGYRVVEKMEPRTELVFCMGDRRRNVGVTFCNETRMTPREEAVAVDMELEQRKLSQLIAKRDALVSHTSRTQAACMALPGPRQ
jgi:hypothetical protein